MDISFHCDKCGQHIVIDETGAGLATECPKCGQTLTVPRQEAQHPKPIASAAPQVAANPADTKQCPFCAETIK